MVGIGFATRKVTTVLLSSMFFVFLFADSVMAEDARVKVARQTFAVLDMDGDQKITDVEFANRKVDGFMVHDRNKDMYLTQDEVLMTPEEFGKIDRNRDGKVSGGELIDSRYGQFEPYDANSNREIDLEEFTRVLAGD